MFRPAPMKRFYLTIPTEKEDEVIESLGKFGSAHLIRDYAVRTPPRAEDFKISENYTRLREKVKSVYSLADRKKGKKSFFGTLKILFTSGKRLPGVFDTKLSTDEVSAYLAETESKIDRIARLKELEREINELKKFSLLEKHELAPDALGDFEHVFVRAGLINKAMIPRLLKYTRGTSVSCDFMQWSMADELAVIAGSIEDKGRIGEILVRLNFDEVKPSDTIKAKQIDKQIAEKGEEAENLKNELLKVADDFNKKSAEIQPIVGRILKREYAKNGISRSGSFSVIQGWVPKSKLAEFENALKKNASEDLVLDVEDPPADEEPPVFTKSAGILKYFDPIIQIRGRPDYHEINPTPIVTILFTIMFGMMFGDIGQGAVFVVLGYALTRGRSDRMRKIGGMLAICGASALFFGFMYGAVFLAEIMPAILFRPLHDINLMIKIAFLFGVAQITFGIVLNIVNKTIQKERANLLGGPHGIAGLTFYLGFISLVLLSGLSITRIGQFLPVLILTFGALAVVIITPMLKAIAHKERFSAGAIESVKELFEVPITFLANSVSYLRIAALALIHGAFALLASTMADGLGVFGILIYLLLNVLVLGLEGLIALVHTIRLIYYEFFTKFYSGTGKPYKPFKIE